MFVDERPPSRQVSPHSALAHRRSPVAGAEHLLFDVVVGNPISDGEVAARGLSHRMTSEDLISEEDAPFTRQVSPGCVVPDEVSARVFSDAGVEVTPVENADASMRDVVRAVRSCYELGMTVSETAHVC